jgi:Spy/CpxP family protein refolding chaperone
MKKTILLILIFVFALANISMARSQGYREKGWGHRKESMGTPNGKWWKRPKLAEKIGITEEEKEKLDNIYYKHRYQMIDLHSQVQKERLELEQRIDSKDFDTKVCIDHFTRLQKARNNRAAERFRFLIKVRELLDLDRFQQLKEQVRKYRTERSREKRRRTKSNTSVK